MLKKALDWLKGKLSWVSVRAKALWAFFVYYAHELLGKFKS